MRKILAVMIVIALIGGVIAADIDAIEPTLKVVYDGPTPIATSLASKSSLSEKVAVLKTATVTAFKDEKYPIVAKNTSETTNVTIDACRCEAERCAYWITAYRGGRLVAVDNPIWLIPGNAPYHTVVSDVYDAKTNTETITLKEDVKGAVINILTMYADMQPIGEPRVGTKE